MGLPTITTKWANIPPEYKIPVPDIFKNLIISLNNIEQIEHLTQWKNTSNGYDFRNTTISLETDEMAFVNNASLHTSSDMGTYDIDVCDPNAVFIVPEYVSNYPVPSITAIKPCIIGSGIPNFDSLIELHGINCPRWFYGGHSGGPYAHPGVIAVDKDTRDLLNLSSSYSSNRFYPSAVVRIKGQHKLSSSSSWSNYNAIARVDLLGLLFGFIQSINGSAPEAAAYVKKFDTARVTEIWTCEVTPTFYGGIDLLGLPSFVPNLTYYNRDVPTSFSEWLTSNICLTANVGRQPYAAFKNLIFVKDAADFDSLFTMPHEDFLDRIVDGEQEAEKEPGEYEPGGVSKPDGGGGSYGNDENSEDITDLLPNGSAESDSSNSGLFTRYAMTSSLLRELGDELYADGLLDKLGKEIMSFLYNSPAEALISLVSYPFSISSIMGTSSTGIKFGSLVLPVLGNRLNGTFAQIDWGSITLKPYWGNFLDYAPHTKIELYLPWCTGSVQLDPHECYPGTISVKTNIELSKGTCIHSVFGNQGALIGTYSGVVGSQLPITALDTSGKMLSMVTAAAALATTAGTTAVAGAKALKAGEETSSLIRRAGGTASEAFRGRNSAEDRVFNSYKTRIKAGAGVALASSIASFKTPQHVVRNGSFSANGAGMAMQFPFIIISRPEQSVPENYGRYFGYPSNIYVSSLNKVRGYTEVGSVHVDGIPCTDNERAEIEELLKGGVIL